MKRQVLIIGAGVAGLAAALKLSQAGYAVTLLDQRGTIGGQSLLADPDSLPLLVRGSDHATRSWLQTLGTAPHLPRANRLALEFLLPDEGTANRTTTARWPLPWMPAPIHAIFGLTFFRGLSGRDRWRLLTWLERTWEGDPPLPTDLEQRTADAWLEDIGQSSVARHRIWDPLARFLVGQGLEAVAASSLLDALTRHFLAARAHAELTLSDCGPGPLLLDPARDALARAGVTFNLDTTVEHIRFDTHRTTGIQCRTGGTLTADWYVAAIPHRHLRPLLPERALTRFAYFQHLTALTDAPSLSVHLWLHQPAPTPRLLLLAQRPFDWLVCRPDAASASESPPSVSLTATAKPDMLARTDQDLLALALEQINAGPFPHPVKATDYRIVRRPQAFLSTPPGGTALRPLQHSPFPNFFLAGAWTDTGLPPTLESAVLSGHLCAEAILAGHSGREPRRIPPAAIQAVDKPGTGD